MTQEHVTLFVAFLASEGLSVATIQSYLAGLRYHKIMRDPVNPSPSFHSPHMKILLRGIRRRQAEQGSSRVRLPITTTLMRRLKGTLAQDAESYRNILLWAACCTGFFGFLRCAEFLLPDGAQFDASAHLSLADIQLVRESPKWYFALHIKKSKTDQFYEGSDVVLGASGEDLCPVAALLDYLGRRGPSPGPLFRLENGAPLQRASFVKGVQDSLAVAGLPGENFNGHSFHLGAATSASAAGVPETTIKLLGRWRSMAYQQYIRPSSQELAKVSSQLLALNPVG